MPDPIIFPAGATIAFSTMNVISWYVTLRTCVQLVHDDFKAAQKYEQDIGNMVVDLIHQERGLEDWKKRWTISKHTSDDMLLGFWGEKDFDIIKKKISLIETESLAAKEELGKFTSSEKNEWAAKSYVQVKMRKIKFIWTKKNYIQKLIDKAPVSMKTIVEAADRGWAIQQKQLYRGINNNTPYHTQIAQLLVQIAKQTRDDINALHLCIQPLREFSIELDLDLFGALTAISQDIHSATIAAVAAAGHMSLDLLLRESDNPTAEMVRARVERSLAKPDGHTRATNAFQSVMTDPQASTHYFASNTSTIFSLCKSFRKGDPCSATRKSLREKISSSIPPSYDQRMNQLHPSKLILGDVSTFRVAYELSQACLIFLRTSWISEVCGCGLHCGGRQDPLNGSWYEFGLNMKTTHDPDLSPIIEGPMNDSWCEAYNPWNVMTKPLRRLGLLLLEITLGTVVQNTKNDTTGSVTHVTLRLQPNAQNSAQQSIQLKNVLALVANAVHGSDGFSDAVKYCLTRVLDQAPFDAEWEHLLKTLYFDIVKPLKDLYDIKLATFPIQRHPAYA